MKDIIMVILLVFCLVFCGCTQDGKGVNDKENTHPVYASGENMDESEEISTGASEETKETEEADVSSDTENNASEEADNAAENETPSEADSPVIKTEEIVTETEEPKAEETVSEGEVTIQEAPAPPPYVAVDGISLTTYDVTLSIGYQTMPYVTMSPANATNKGEIWTSSDTSVATVDHIGNIKGVSVGNCTVTVTSTDNPAVFAAVNVNVIPDTECTYIDGILIANKTYPLPKDYAPGWDPVASEALNVMFAAAKEEGLSLWVCSGYRSYIDQKIIYNGYVARDGKEAADRYSARPGLSELQTGLAFDINNTYSSFADTAEGKWLAENCYKYGFIIRYPKDKEHITGYMYEPWHVRYLGTEKAKEVYDSGLCLEEFLGITSAYSY